MIRIAPYNAQQFSTPITAVYANKRNIMWKKQHHL